MSFSKMRRSHFQPQKKARIVYPFEVYANNA